MAEVGPGSAQVPPCGEAPLEPYVRGLRAFADGDATAVLLVRRDDGLETPLPVRHFFRAEKELTPIERRALDACGGRVLDVGAGTGIHARILQRRGLEVTAIDRAAAAVEIMAERGVRDARCRDFFDFDDGPYDTLLLMGHGVGMAGDLAGLDRLLAHARTLLRPGGSLLLDSVAVTRTDDPDHVAYHEANRRAGRYVGETRIQFGFRGERGPFCAWLHVEPDTLLERAAAAGLSMGVLHNEESGEYLARLVRRDGKGVPG